MNRVLLGLAAAGCGNQLPDAGHCNAATTTAVPDVTSVQLVGTSVAFDDLQYAPDLGRVIAEPEGSGKLFLIDPDSLAVTRVSATTCRQRKAGRVTCLVMAYSGIGFLARVAAKCGR